MFKRKLGGEVVADSVDYDPYAMPGDAVQKPPSTLWLALRKIGPGIILAGSINRRLTNKA